MMSRKKYVVGLSRDERERLKAVISKGKSAAKTILKARILLKADQGPWGEGWTDDRIVRALDSNQSMATARRTAIDYAHVLKQLSDVHFPRAETIVLVQDNLNTHAPSSLYQAFPPAEARRIAQRFEWHYTPKHGSWLNMAEAELSVLARQCLARRIPDIATLEQQVTAWLQRRNKYNVKADWRFTSQDARIKLKNLYPVL